MGRCDSVYLTEVGDTQVVVFKHGQSLLKKKMLIFKPNISFCKVEVQQMLLWCCLLLTEKEEGAISTLVLRGSTDNLMDDIERAVDDGVNSFKVLVRVSPQNESEKISQLNIFTALSCALLSCFCNVKVYFLTILLFFTLSVGQKIDTRSRSH